MLLVTASPDDAPLTTSDLDADIERELRRGEVFTVTLPRNADRILHLLVSSVSAESQDELPSTHGLLGGLRDRRVLTKLSAMRFVRYDEDQVVPTVAGIGAAYPHAVSLDSGPVSASTLRELRRAELAA